LQLIYPVLKNDGKVLLVTDDDSYAENAREIAMNSVQYKLIEDTEPITMTSYHRRAIRLGHNINKLAIQKIKN
jgi:tRNA G46 methylase TrmB